MQPYSLFNAKTNLLQQRSAESTCCVISYKQARSAETNMLSSSNTATLAIYNYLLYFQASTLRRNQPASKGDDP